jgi:murein DD-endopeptidase MepM/ murein hydrolase activator NlpD
VYAGSTDPFRGADGAGPAAQAGPVRPVPPLALAFAAVVAWPTPAAAAAPRWGWPLPAPHIVVRAFAPPRLNWLPGHRGVDLRGLPGERVVAAGAGVVSFAGTVAGTPVVSVRHPDGLLTTYEPVVAVVAAGARVRRGQRVGRLVGDVLHWGLRSGPGDYLDPLSLVRPTVVRLLPLYADHPGWVLPPQAPAAALGAASAASAAGAATLSAARRRRRRSAVSPPPRSRRRRPAPS